MVSPLEPAPTAEDLAADHRLAEIVAAEALLDNPANQGETPPARPPTPSATGPPPDPPPAVWLPRLDTDLAMMLLAVAGALLWSRWPTGPQPPPANSLVPASVSVPLHEPIELDGWTRDQVWAHRSEQVALHPELHTTPYNVSRKILGAVEGGLPWWGIEGQFCRGPGPEAHAGPSEESRLVSNPYLLVGLLESWATSGRGQDCVPVWPRPVSLVHGASQAEVVYDLSHFAQRKRATGLKVRRTLQLAALNARDWGFTHLSILAAQGVGPSRNSKLFDGPVLLRAYIHRGMSCGMEGGCNNGSPREPDLYFRVEELPARLELGLWKAEPGPRTPDMRFVIVMR